MADVDAEIGALVRQQMELNRRIAALVATRHPEPVADHVVHTASGPQPLSALFGDHPALWLIHNMGPGCAWCAAWADMLDGLRHQLEQRAALVLCSPKPLAGMQALAARRGWGLTLASAEGTSLVTELGFASDAGVMPGLSVLQKTDDGLQRTAKASFGPGDRFNGLYPLLDLLPGGAVGFRPLPV